MAALTPTSPAVPAGWYPDPHGRGQRYWDGTAWTDNIAPLAAALTKRASVGDWVGGVLLAVLMPIIGMVAGAVYMSKGDDRHQVGVMTLTLSVVMIVVWFLVLSGSSTSTSGY